MKKFFYAVSTLILLICLFFSPVPVTGEITSLGIDVKPVQYRTAKQFSEKFCDAILAGLGNDNALVFASGELYRVILNPLIWTNAIVVEGGAATGFSQESLVAIASSNIVNNCGKELGISREEGFSPVKEYLSSKMDAFVLGD